MKAAQGIFLGAVFGAFGWVLIALAVWLVIR